MWKKFKLFWDKLEKLHRKKWIENQKIHRRMMGK
jgi:hypothetical protein